MMFFPNEHDAMSNTCYVRIRIPNLLSILAFLNRGYTEPYRGPREKKRNGGKVKFIINQFFIKYNISV